MFTEHGGAPRRTLTQRVLGSGLVDLLTGPHGVDRFTEIPNGVWTIKEARAEVLAVDRNTPRSTTLTLRPNAAFTGFRAGQHVNVYVEIDGRRYTRCYSPASGEQSPGGILELTVGVHEQGVVSNFIRNTAKPGMVLGLDSVGGEFLLPDERPEKIAFVSGGSGITPVLSMLRTLCAEGHTGDVTFVHYARTAEEAGYVNELNGLAAKHPNVTVLHGYTRDTAGSDLHGRFSADTIDADAAIFACGPAALTDAVREIHGERVAFETFVPPVFVVPENPGGGAITFSNSAVEITDDGRTILEQAEAAGLTPESGCRMGICHSCTCRKTSGAVRNLLTGAVSTTEEESVQICISVPVGDVELAI